MQKVALPAGFWVFVFLFLGFDFGWLILSFVVFVFGLLGLDWACGFVLVGLRFWVWVLGVVWFGLVGLGC